MVQPEAAPAPAALSEEEIFSRKSLDQVNAEKPLEDVFFDLDQAPRPFHRVSADKDASYFLNDKTVPTDPDDD